MYMSEFPPLELPSTWPAPRRAEPRFAAEAHPPVVSGLRTMSTWRLRPYAAAGGADAERRRSRRNRSVATSPVEDEDEDED